MAMSSFTSAEAKRRWYSSRTPTTNASLICPSRSWFALRVRNATRTAHTHTIGGSADLVGDEGIELLLSIWVSEVLVQALESKRECPRVAEQRTKR